MINNYDYDYDDDDDDEEEEEGRTHHFLPEQTTSSHGGKRRGTYMHTTI